MARKSKKEGVDFCFIPIYCGKCKKQMNLKSIYLSRYEKLGYPEFCCGHRPITKEYLEKQRQVQLIAQNRPEVKLKKSIANTIAASKPEVKARISKAQKIASLKPEVKENQSKVMKKVWSDVDRRKKLSDKQKIIKNLPGKKEEQSKRMKKIANDPEVKAKIKATKKKNHKIYSYERMIFELGEIPLCQCEDCLKNNIKIIVKPDKNGSYYRYRKRKGYPKYTYGHNSKGINNPNWKGGIKPLYNKIRDSQKYNEWRISIFIRDNFTCQECKDNKGGNLEAHHCNKRFIDILEEYNILSLEEAFKCEFLWDIINGITLCKKCHKKTENYGKKKTNKNNKKE